MHLPKKISGLNYIDILGFVKSAAPEKLREGRTSFVIAHRLSTIRNAGQVLVIEDGRIVERGTHTTLLAQKGAHYALYMRQFREEEDGSGVVNAG